MYEETRLLFPYFQNFYQEVQQLDDFFKTQKSNAFMSNPVQSSMVSDYDLGEEGDLFKAPEPIIEEPMMSLDPMTPDISMISCLEDAFKATDIESLRKEQLLSDAFYECEKDLFEKAAIESPLPEVLDIKIPVFMTNESQLLENNPLPDSLFKKSVSSGCISSMKLMHEAATKPKFLDFLEMDPSVIYGIRRAFSEGDVKTLGNGCIRLVHSPHGQQPLVTSNCTSEERMEKLSRYRNKKTKRNFGRKIKYACRKALADSQPRIRGRFAKTEESDSKVY